MRASLVRAIFLVLGWTLATLLAFGQEIDSRFYNDMRWRCIGPFRGGRTVAATGVSNDLNVFYVGVNNGGVWKTNDFGRTWKPIFDDQPTGSIGAIAVAWSNPNVIYVGSGEGLQRPDLSVGDGIYKSTDGGKNWAHLGLRDGQQISAIIVDPKNEDRLFVAVLGHPYGPNPERGVYRSLDGGTTFEKVLGPESDTGAVALSFDPTNAKTVYADLWAARQGPWENGHWQGSQSGLYRSTDGGATWKKLEKGFPANVGRIGFSISPSNPKRMFATVDAKEGGIFKSEDRGDSWVKVADQARLWGRGDDFAEIRIDPKDPDTVFVANTSVYKSTDAGKTWTAIKGAPGGDDYHTIWISPVASDIILLASDQGATITVNGGETWSSWYNQPTAQFYHVSTDNQFPYWVYGGQQESGSAGVASRGNDGQITFREWHPVGVEEYGYVAPDPLNPRFIYGGKLTRTDRVSGRVDDVRPPQAKGVRFLRTAPVLFSPVDPHVLYFAGSVLFRTSDGARSWEVISPDLSREHPDVPLTVGVYRTPELGSMARRGVIYTVAPGYKDKDVIWAGTDDGLIHRTADGGKTWKDVTPPDLTAWSKVSLIDAGRFDSLTAYAAVNRIRLDDMRPHIYRTHDGGVTWKEITTGLPNDPINSVREDPERKGLLYCGSERSVYFSLDDGDHWNSLRLNMPASSIRDLVIHEDDLVVATHGRSFWILDDLNPVRQLAAQATQPYLVSPPAAYLVERNTNTDTPLPPEEPAGQNPPDGAILDYYLPANATTVTLEILNGKGEVVRYYSSNEQVLPLNPDDMDVPAYWARTPRALSAKGGHHRFIWDLRTTPPSGRKYLPISAIVHDTPGQPQGDWVTPGGYSVRLKVDGKVFVKALILRADPRAGVGPGVDRQGEDLDVG